jgi:membrane-bound lytic murein transglycosylase A
MENFMNRRMLLIVLFALVFMLSVSGCRKEAQFEPWAQIDYNRPLLPGQVALRKILDPSQIPDFTTAAYDLKDVRSSINNSLNYLSKASSKGFFPMGDITHQRVVDSLNEFGSLLDKGYIGSALNDAIREKFDVYESVGCDNMGTVLFTSYYTPIFDGSRTQTAKYRYPLYKKPKDLVKDVNGNILGRKVGGQTVPYPSRSEIESSGMLAGTELMWLGDEFEVYIAHVQGSAKIRLAGGEVVGIGYAATNGHEYKGISEAMISDGRITRSQLSLSSMIAHFKSNPQDVAPYTAANPRFVFFRDESGDPRGSLNEPVTAMRTIATDKTVFPRGGLAFISANLPQSLADGQIITRNYTGFALDQDTGGAIRAAGRCDLYMGVGDLAGQLAGMVHQEGRLYYLFKKEY